MIPDAHGPWPAARRFGTSPWIVGLYAALGAACVGVAALVPFVATDPLPALLLMALPMGALGAWLLRSAGRLRRTRVVLDDEGVLLCIPEWAGGWLREGGGEVRLGWDEIRSLAHEQVVSPSLSATIPVDEYTIEGPGGRYVLTRNIVPRPDQVLRLISERTGLDVEER